MEAIRIIFTIFFLLVGGLLVAKGIVIIGDNVSGTDRLILGALLIQTSFFLFNNYKSDDRQL